MPIAGLVHSHRWPNIVLDNNRRGHKPTSSGEALLWSSGTPLSDSEDYLPKTDIAISGLSRLSYYISFLLIRIKKHATRFPRN
uniref:IP07088p n=1 Tax=Drosophila melanogaster TaxID=7227 RepID=Q4V5J1_DROME|nr:IP07088p [Drosophila melanogaster]